VLRSNTNFKKIIDLLINDVPQYNENHAKKREAKLKEIYDFQKFRKEIQHQLRKQQQSALKEQNNPQSAARDVSDN